MDFHDWKKVSAFLKIEVCARGGGGGRFLRRELVASMVLGIGVVFSNTSKSALDKTTNIDPWASSLLRPYILLRLFARKNKLSEWNTGKLSIVLFHTLNSFVYFLMIRN